MPTNDNENERKNNYVFRIINSIGVSMVKVFSTWVCILFFSLTINVFAFKLRFRYGLSLLNGFLRKVTADFNREGLLVFVEALVFSQADLFSCF
jgi:hypothetical protein